MEQSVDKMELSREQVSIINSHSFSCAEVQLFKNLLKSMNPYLPENM